MVISLVSDKVRKSLRIIKTTKRPGAKQEAAILREICSAI
jgi:hypothetical protein